MNQKPPTNCCGPCENIGYCRVDVNCCTECHMAYEEYLVQAYLPPAVFAQLQYEHNRIEAAGFPAEDLLQHSIWEEALFEHYNVPQPILQQIRKDHEEYEQGRLHSRAAVM